ncbi:GMC oxidoreductase [Streptomyces sp. NPDC056831]|uniref:GMC oxidoreductase n=1 Tax=Streptomyces sp. NPDC056831 TaxID=3345954 RepID=UPI0036984EDD
MVLALDGPRPPPGITSTIGDRGGGVRGVSASPRSAKATASARQAAGAPRAAAGPRDRGQPAPDDWAGAEPAPGPDVMSDDALLDCIVKICNTLYHPSATVKMGPDAGPTAPLDPRPRVRGIRGLRVADGSAMPDLIIVNPCVTTMVTGEKCADTMKEDTKV